MTPSLRGLGPGGPGGAEDTWLVFGLGNPGPSYAGHRHSVGHMVVHEMASRQQGTMRPFKRGEADVLERWTTPGGRRCILATGRTYMNVSGGPVASLTRFFKIDPARLVVVHDELDIPFEAVRVKFGGGDNGHNGLRSIRQSLGTGDFHRVRVGVGRPPGRQDVADYVLSDYAPRERVARDVQVARAADAVHVLVDEGLAAAQQQFHAG